MSKHPVAAKLHTILAELDDQFVSRHDLIRLAMITLLAKQHMFILGKPGTAKSMVIRAIVERLVDASYFEMLLSKTRSDSAVLGPPDLPALRDNGEFKRKSAGFLQTANIAFLDEIGKMAPTTGHDILSVLNERIIHEVNGGRSVQEVPLYSAFTASNELLLPQSDDAAALWDRLLVRTTVDHLEDSSSFAKLLTSDLKPSGNTMLDWADLAHVIDVDVPAVTVSKHATDGMVALRKTLLEKGVENSDRRWLQSMTLMRASAFFDGRTEATEDDLWVLSYTLWNEPKDIAIVTAEALKIGNPLQERTNDITAQIEGLRKQVANAHGDSRQDRAKLAVEINTKLKKVGGELLALEQEVKRAGRSTGQLDNVFSGFENLNKECFTELMNVAEGSVPEPDALKAHRSGAGA